MGCNGSKSVNAIITDGDGQTKELENVETASTRPVTPQPVRKWLQIFFLILIILKIIII